MSRFVIYTDSDSIVRLFPLLNAKSVDCLIVSSEPLAARTRHSVVVTSNPSLAASLTADFKPDVVVEFFSSGRSTRVEGAEPSPTQATLTVAVAEPSGRMQLESKTYAKEAVANALASVVVTLSPTNFECSKLSEVVKLDPELDTAVSVTYKVEMAGLSVLRKFFDRYDSFVAAEPPKLKFDFTLKEEISDSALRGLFLPPKSVAVVSEGGEGGKAHLVEDLWTLEKLKADLAAKAKASAASSGSGPASKTGPASGPAGGAGTFYTNVGGSIVKAGTDLSQLLRESGERLRMNEPLPGVNVWRYVSEVLTSGWLGVEGPFVRLLERRFAALCGGVGAVAVHSGTAALWGALKALGVAAPSSADGAPLRQTVLCPAFTCAACADAVEQAGGRAVIVDCETETFGLSYDAVCRALEDPTVARTAVGVVVAPCYGVPARDLLQIRRLCTERGLFLVEDNCESYGATFEASEALPGGGGESGRVAVGGVGDMSVVSIRSEKMVGVGEGGVIISKSQALVDKARWWCSRAPTRGVGLWRVYEHDEVGMNYRLPELLAAVGCAAMENLPVMISRKRQIHEWYVEELRKRGDLEIRFQNFGASDEPVWWINALVLPEKLRGKAEQIGMTLIERRPRIEIRPGFYPLNKMKPFASLAQNCPNAADLYARMLCLPSSPMLKREDVQFICEGLFQVVDEVLSSTLNA